ncbi:hypothetical protein DITRI_Ditri18aG0035800 [Diplodiscus trichospermus]
MFDKAMSSSLDEQLAKKQEKQGQKWLGYLSTIASLAGSRPGVAGAEQIGMPRVVLQSSFTSRAEFPSANAIMEGFGGADLTISKLCDKPSS